MMPAVHCSAIRSVVTNHLYGDAYFISGFAHGGNDSLIGGSADFLGEQIYGDDYIMSGFSTGGDDSIIGGGSWHHGSAITFGQDSYIVVATAEHLTADDFIFA